MQKLFLNFRTVTIGVILVFMVIFPSSCDILKMIILTEGGGHGGGGNPDYSGSQMPLNEPARFDYKGLESGLYPWGNELISNSYKSAYIDVCESILPTNSNGIRDDNGKVLGIGIGASNPAILFDGFVTAHQNDPGFGKTFKFINAAINAQDLAKITSYSSAYWDNVRKILSDQGYSNNAVQVIFCMEDNLRNKDTSFQRAYDLKSDFVNLLDIIREEFPNCKLFLVCDRGFTGYTSDAKHDEPKGYLNGWSVKLLVEDYVEGKLPELPFVNWLDYYWTNGDEERFDGESFRVSDFKGPEYVHFTQEKGNAMAARTHERLKKDEGAQMWYE